MVTYLGIRLSGKNKPLRLVTFENEHAQRTVSISFTANESL